MPVAILSLSAKWLERGAYRRCRQLRRPLDDCIDRD